MPINDSKSSELAKLKNRMLEVEAQLREEKKVTAKLRENSEKKTQHIMAFDAEIASEAESFKWKREKNISDRRFLSEESIARLATLTERELYLRNTISEFDFVVYENEMLHNMIKEVSHEQLKYAAIQVREREKKSQRNFDARIEMEDVHRHTIMGFNNEYQKEAVSSKPPSHNPDCISHILCRHYLHFRSRKWSWKHRKPTRRTTGSTQNSISVRRALTL